MVTITKVDTSKDLRYSKIGLSIFPTEKTDEIFALIRKNLKQLKFALHQHITFKYAPDIKVYIDTTAQEAAEMDVVLDKIKKRHS